MPATSQLVVALKVQKQKKMLGKIVVLILVREYESVNPGRLRIDEVSGSVVRSRLRFGGEQMNEMLQVYSKEKEKSSASLRKIFVPSGTAIADEYMRYQIFHVCQDLCTQLRASLATTAVFAGLGLGRDTAQRGAASATAVFLSRDAVGAFTSLLATGRVSDHLSADVRRYRFLGDVFVDIALFLELLTVRGNALLFLLCAASALKAACGVVAGGANAAITAYFAASTHRADFAEVTAKTNAITTISGLLGLGISLLATTLVCFSTQPLSSSFIHLDTIKRRASLSCYCLLTVAHLWSCAAGLRLLRLNTIGCLRRFRLLYFSFFRIDPKCLTPQELAKLDPVAAMPSPALRDSLILIDTHPAKHFLLWWPYLSAVNYQPLSDFIDATTPFLLLPAHTPNDDLTSLQRKRPRSPRVVLLLGTNIDAKQERRALCHAYKLAADTTWQDTPSFLKVAEMSALIADSEASDFEAALTQAGFNLDVRILPASLATLDTSPPSS